MGVSVPHLTTCDPDSNFGINVLMEVMMELGWYEKFTNPSASLEIDSFAYSY